MAVIWCDPYIDSTGGGIHGTTGNGSGTYASPYTMAQLTSCNVPADGDEVRLKGLAEDDFWQSSVAFTAVTLEGGDATKIKSYGYTGITNGIIRFKTSQTARYLRTAPYSTTSQPTMQDANTWNTPVPYLDQTFGRQEIEAGKLITGSSKNILTGDGASNSSKKITITAGWVSETSQVGGATVLASTVCGFTFGNSIGQSDATGPIVSLDAPQLHIISRSTASYVYGADVNIGTLYGYAWNTTAIYASTSLTVGVFSGYSGGLRMYNYMSGGSNDRFDARVDYLSQPYFLPIEFFTDKDTSVARFQFSFKEFHVSYGQAIGANTSTKIDFIALTDHQLDNKGSYEYSLSANAVENSYVENSTSINYEFGWGTYTSDMPFKGPSLSAARLKSVPVPANPSPGIKESSTPFSVASLGGQTGPSAIVDKFENTTALESLDSKCVSGAGSAAYGSPVKLTCLADAAGGIPVQLMFASNSSTVPSPCFVFRSTSFNHKVTWTLGSPTNAGVFADTFAVDFPGQGSDRTFSVDITTSASADVVIKAQLYTVSNVGAVTGHGLQTAAVAGTAVTVTQTITASALSSAVTSYVILEVTKGSASSIANAAINSMGLA